MVRVVMGCAVALGVVGCGPNAQRAVPTGTELEAPADSATAAELGRFRDGLIQTGALTGGAATRDDLIAGFVAALERSDTAALVRMHLTDAEFAWLYYPESPYARQPYRQDPALFWMLLRENSEKGILRLLRSYAGRDLEYGGVACEAKPGVEGRNRLWAECVLRVRPPQGGSGPAPTRLFGSIIERDGRFKFVSYTNDL